MPNINLNRPLIFVDFETTGLDVEFDRIVEFTTLKVYPDGGNEIKSEMLNPGIPIPLAATRIHGISNLYQVPFGRIKFAFRVLNVIIKGLFFWK